MLTLKHEELLDKLFVAPFNEDIEAQREYVLEHEDYPERYWNVLLGDNFVANKERIKGRLESFLDTELSLAEYEHLADWIDTGEIEYILKVNPYIERDELEKLDQYPINEEECQFRRKNERLIKALTDEEFEYVTDRLEAYVTERNKELYYLYFGYNTFAELWVNVNELEEELNKYRDNEKTGN